MEFKISSGELSSLLQSIAKVVPVNSTLPILSHFLFEIENGSLHVTASDQSLRISGVLPLLASEGNCSFTVRPKDVIDYIKNLPDQPLTFAYNQENSSVSVTFDGGYFKFVCSDASLYPRKLSPASLTPHQNEEEPVLHSATLTVDTLRHALEAALPAVASDEKRPILTGVCMDFIPEGLTFVATNGFILTKMCDLKTQAVPEKEEHQRIVLPPKTGNFLRGFLPRYAGEPIHITYTQSKAVFSLGSVEISTLLLAGRFPNYASIIPAESPHQVQIDGKRFTNIIKRIYTFLAEDKSIVKLQFTDQAIVISSGLFGEEKMAHENFPCDVPDNLRMTIAFGTHDLVQILSCMGEGDMVFHLADQTRPLLVKPLDLEEGKDLLCLIVPKTLSA